MADLVPGEACKHTHSAIGPLIIPTPLDRQPGVSGTHALGRGKGEHWNFLFLLTAPSPIPALRADIVFTCLFT